MKEFFSILGIVLIISIGFLVFQHPKRTIVETFSNLIVVQNGLTFGPGNEFTFSLGQKGTFVIDGTSGLAWEQSNSYRDSAFIRST